MEGVRGSIPLAPTIFSEAPPLVLFGVVPRYGVSLNTVPPFAGPPLMVVP